MKNYVIQEKTRNALTYLSENPGIRSKHFAEHLYGNSERKSIQNALQYLANHIRKGWVRKDDRGCYYITREGANAVNASVNPSEGPRGKYGLRVGQPVRYISPMTGKVEKGVVKSLGENERDGWASIVFDCAGNWLNYMDYKGADCKVDNLVPGWK